LSATLTNQTQLQQTAISAGALTSGAQLLRVVCHQATGLKSGDMFSKNDVYVQSYFVPIDTDASKALPVPEKNMQLPVGEYVIPFEFKIPNGTLPSSCEASGFGWGVNEAYVRWSVYSNIDISWRLDPSSRRIITVLCSESPPIEMLHPCMRPTEEPENITGCCGCTSLGSASLACSVDRRCVAPGDTLYFTAHAVNQTELDAVLRVKVRMHSRMKADGGYRSQSGSHEWELYSQAVAKGDTASIPTHAPIQLKIPMVAPSFSGGDAGHWSSGEWKKKNGYDPLRWFYTLEVTLDMPGMMVKDIVWEVPLFVGAAPKPVLQQLMPQLAFNPGQPPMAVVIPTLAKVDEPFFMPTPVVYGNPNANANANANIAPGVVPVQNATPAVGTVVSVSPLLTAMPVAGGAGQQYVSGGDGREDTNNFGGAVAAFTPMYAVPSVVTPLVVVMPELAPLGGAGGAGGAGGSVGTVGPATVVPIVVMQQPGVVVAPS